MQITNELSGYQLVALNFSEDAVAASQSNAQLSVCDVGSAQLNNGYIMPWDGFVVGISYALNAAATVGGLTLGPTIGGTECADPTLAVTTGTGSYDRCNRSANPFSAGDAIGAEMTSSADWNGTTSDLLVTVWCVVKLAGI